MPTAIKLSAGRIEHWATMGKIAEENPDMTYEFIKDVPVSKQALAAGDLEPYAFDKKDHEDFSSADLCQTGYLYEAQALRAAACCLTHNHFL